MNWRTALARTYLTILAVGVGIGIICLWGPLVTGIVIAVYLLLGTFFLALDNR